MHVILYLPPAYKQQLHRIRNGSVAMSIKDEYPTGGGICQKRGGSEKMIIQQEVGMSKKGVGKKVNKR